MSNLRIFKTPYHVNNGSNKTSGAFINSRRITTITMNSHCTASFTYQYLTLTLRWYDVVVNPSWIQCNTCNIAIDATQLFKDGIYLSVFHNYYYFVIKYILPIIQLIIFDTMLSIKHEKTALFGLLEVGWMQNQTVRYFKKFVVKNYVYLSPGSIWTDRRCNSKLRFCLNFIRFGHSWVFVNITTALLFRFLI